MDRRETIKWMLAASAVIPLARLEAADSPSPYGHRP